MFKKLIDMFPHLEKRLKLPFSGTLLQPNLSTLHGYNLTRDLHFHRRFGDFVSKSQVYQKYKLQIALLFRFLSAVV